RGSFLGRVPHRTYALSLHDALPISGMRAHTGGRDHVAGWRGAGSGSRMSGADLSDPNPVAATTAVDVSSEPIARVASSKDNGGRVERSGGIADDAILVWELCKRRCSF